MLFFKIVFEFNFGTALGEYLLKAVNNFNDVGLTKFGTDPNNNAGYLIQVTWLSF